MPFFKKKNKVAPKPVPPPPPTPPPPPPRASVGEITPKKRAMNTAILKAMMERRQFQSCLHGERDARTKRREEARANFFRDPALEAFNAARERIARNNERILRLIANTTIDPASTPDVPDIKHPPRPLPEFKKGGKVKKTGLAKVHKGEIVIPANRVESVKKAMRVAKLAPLKE